MLRLLTLGAWITLSFYSLADGFRFTGHEVEVYGNNDNKETPEDDYKDWHDDDSIFKDTKNLSTDSFSNSFEKRQGHLKHLCSCPSVEEMQDFGEGTYPQYYRARVCDTNGLAGASRNCHHGAHCKEFHHKILLLKLRKGATDDEGQHELPRDVKKKYYWRVQDISVDCRCTLP